MSDNQLLPEEQQLVQQIQAVSKPKIGPAARVAIRQRLLTEFRTVMLHNQRPIPLTHPHLPIHWKLVSVAAVVAVMVGLLVIRLGYQNTAGVVLTLTPTALPGSQVAVAPSETVIPTVARETLTPVPSPTTASVSNTPTTQSLIETDTPLPPIATQEMVINIEGPITSIVGNIVAVYNFNVEVEPQNPILQIIDVGDVVHVRGVLADNGRVVPNMISNIPDTAIISGSTATVGLDGPVEAIDGNTIVVNSIPVQLAPNDDLLRTLRVGNFVSVQGNFELSNSRVVLVVVNIAIVNSTVIQNNCSYHVDAMGMGHWHCDGMGMGMGDDGMGMGDMGMGDAMGMGMGG